MNACEDETEPLGEGPVDTLAVIEHGAARGFWQGADAVLAVKQLAERQSRALAEAAWSARAHAHLHGKTAVGAAVLSAQGNVFAGCNVEHRFRAHDVHAEVNALTSMTAAGNGPALAVVIAAERERFTPCGGCLDWIFELGGPDVWVSFQGHPSGQLETLRADELMPHYPC